MEEKRFHWLLSELFNKRIPLKILDIGICRGSKLLDLFYTDSTGMLLRKSIKNISGTKQLLSYFLSQKVQNHGEASLEKVVCYLYHKKGVKVVNSREASELAVNQLHGLQVKSIHLALSSSINYYKVYKFSAHSEAGELKAKLCYGPIDREKCEEINDAVTYEKILSFTIYVSDFLSKTCLKPLNSIKIDFTVDISGSIFIINIYELTLATSVASPEGFLLNKTHFIKGRFDRSDSLSTEELNSDLNNAVRVLMEKEEKKKINDSKNLAKKPHHTNSSLFLEMMAKTFDRERKLLEQAEKLKKKKVLINKQAEPTNNLARMNSLKQSGDALHENLQISSMPDLLCYVERTRPRIWLQDRMLQRCDSLNLEGNTSLHRYDSSFKKSEPIDSMKNFHSASYLRSPKLENIIEFAIQERIERAKKRSAVTSYHNSKPSTTMRVSRRKNTRLSNVNSNYALRDTLAKVNRNI